MAKRSAADTIVVSYEHTQDTSDKGTHKFGDVDDARGYLIDGFLPHLFDTIDERGGQIADGNTGDYENAFEFMQELGDLGRALVKARTLPELREWAEDWNRLTEDNYFDYKIEID